MLHWYGNNCNTAAMSIILIGGVLVRILGMNFSLLGAVYSHLEIGGW